MRPLPHSSVSDPIYLHSYAFFFSVDPEWSVSPLETVKIRRISKLSLLDLWWGFGLLRWIIFMPGPRQRWGNQWKIFENIQFVGTDKEPTFGLWQNLKLAKQKNKSSGEQKRQAWYVGTQRESRSYCRCKVRNVQCPYWKCSRKVVNPEKTIWAHEWPDVPTRPYQWESIWQK